MDLDRYLREMVTRNASDLFLSAGAAPAMKVEGETHLLEAPALAAAETDAVADLLLDVELKFGVQSLVWFSHGFDVAPSFSLPA